MSTPKNYVSGGISKRLLTPCRRVGLSRSKKTPNLKCTQEATKTKSTGRPNGGTDFNATDNTPKKYSEDQEHEKPKLKRRIMTPRNYNISVKSDADSISREPQDTIKTPTPQQKSKSTNNQHENAEIKPVISLNVDAAGQEIKDPDSPIYSAEISEVSAKVHHSARRNIDFNEVTSNMALNESCTPNDVSASDDNSEDEFCFNKRKCKVMKMDNDCKRSREPVLAKSDSLTGLSRFTTEEHSQDQAENPDLFEISSENLNHSENRTDILETSVFQDPKVEEKEKGYMAIYCPLIENTAQEQLCNQLVIEKTLRLNVDRLPQSLLVSKPLIEYEESDDELFTSSPESDKKQRASLLKMISQIDQVVKEKEDTLERLKRAQTYKKLHNLKELHHSTELWLQGCRLGLKDLLKKRQESESLDMDSLLLRLRIPSEIIDKLNL